MKTLSLLIVNVLAFSIPGFTRAEQAAATVAPKPPAWIAKSDANGRLILEAFARFSPEFAGQLGVEGFDDQVTDLKPQVFERNQKAIREVQATLEARLASETEASVKQDLEILIQSVKDNIEGGALNQKYLVSYFDVPQTVFQGIRALLDDQVPAERRAKAVVRLKRYAGLEPGYTPITMLAQERTRERLREPDLVGPFKGEVEKNLGNSASYVDGIAKLFGKYGIKGYEPAFAKLKQQVAAYDAFLRAEVLPRARTDYRLKPELYAFALRQFGVDIPPDELAARARVGFMEIRNEMRALARLVAKEKGFPATDYRDVIRELKKHQLVGESILPHYQKRMRELEDIIRRERVVTLPARDARIRLASEAESAAVPAPNMRPPRLIGNTGEMGEFVLPLRVPTTGPDGKQTVKGYDDFTFDAASWTLTVHEGRPGHELQFAAFIEKGVSLARGIFAANSVNIEGWALYAEAEMKPYEPLDGRRAPAPPAARRPRVSRPRPPGGPDHARRRHAVPHGGGRRLRAGGPTGSRALHVPSAGASHELLLRLPALDADESGNRDGAREEVRPPAVSRLRARARVAATRRDRTSRARGVRAGREGTCE